MRVFNITDASTAALRNQGLENQHIKVGEVVIPPGGSVDLRGTAKERSELQVYVKVGAVSLEELPVVYAAKRGLTVLGVKLVQEQPAEDVTQALIKLDEPVDDLPEPTPDKKAWQREPRKRGE